MNLILQALFVGALLVIPTFLEAAAPVVLTGTVSSQAEGAMEGVLVRAKRIGGTITVTVVSDAAGRYVYAAGRLAPGEYELSIRAIGYDMANPQQTVTVGKEESRADIRLQKTHDLA